MTGPSPTCVTPGVQDRSSVRVGMTSGGIDLSCGRAASWLLQAATIRASSGSNVLKYIRVILLFQWTVRRQPLDSRDDPEVNEITKCADEEA